METTEISFCRWLELEAQGLVNGKENPLDDWRLSRKLAQDRIHEIATIYELAINESFGLVTNLIKDGIGVKYSRRGICIN